MLKRRKKKPQDEINASSMADIAFLLLIFFLVTTTIASDKGLTIILPPKKDERSTIDVNKRNVYTILVNSRNQLLVQNELMNIKDLRQGVKKFITNNGANPESSVSPQDAVVAFKTDRATQHGIYLRVYDEINAAYNELRSAKLGMSLQQYLSYEKDKAKKDPILIEKANRFTQKLEPKDVSGDPVDYYLNFNLNTIDGRKKRQIDAYKAARASGKITFVEKYYDVQKEFPKRISKAEPTKTE
jgi:biopolymer transport protein ExbD